MPERGPTWKRFVLPPVRQRCQWGLAVDSDKETFLGTVEKVEIENLL